MKKFIITTILLLSCISAFANADDTKGHWAENEINWAYEKGIINGYPDNTFRPDNTITRAEALKTIVSLYNTESDEKLFDDVNTNDWFFKYVSKGHSLMPELKDNFYPNENITRQDAIYAVIKAKYGEIADNNNQTNFNDDYLIADYAKTYINYATKVQIINGYTDNTIKPASFITRAEFAKILMKTDSLATDDSIKEPETENESGESISNFIHIKSIKSGIDQEGNPIKEIEGHNITLVTTGNFDTNIKPGDTIIPLLNHKNLVRNCTVLASVENNTVKFNEKLMNEANNKYKRTKYYFGEIKEIERDKFVTLTNNIEFIVDTNANINFYDSYSRNKYYTDYLDIFSFEDGKIYNENVEIEKAYIIAREYDGIVNDVTIYIF